MMMKSTHVPSNITGTLLLVLALLSSTNSAKHERAEEYSRYAEYVKYVDYTSANIPDACLEFKGRKFEKCMESWEELKNVTFADHDDAETTTEYTEIATESAKNSPPPPMPMVPSSKSPTASPSIKDAYSVLSLPTEIAHVMGLNIPSSSNAHSSGDILDGATTSIATTATTTASTTTAVKSPIGGDTSGSDVHDKEIHSVDSLDKIDSDAEVWQDTVDHYWNTLDQTNEASSSTGDSVSNTVEDDVSIDIANPSLVDSGDAKDLTSEAATSRIVYINLGIFDMSLTIYSPILSSERARDHDNNQRYLNEDNTFSNSTDSSFLFARQFELAATKQHLFNVYQERFPNYPLVSLQLNFTRDGETSLSQGMVRYSSFTGTVGFEDFSLDANQKSTDNVASYVPGKEEVEITTLEAFLEPMKKDFLQLLHELFVDERDGDNAIEYDATLLYDVSVRTVGQKTSSGDTDIEPLLPPRLEDEPPTVDSSKNTQQSLQSDDRSSDDVKHIALTIISVTVILISVLGIAVYIWTRHPEIRRKIVKGDNRQYEEFDDNDDEIILFDDVDEEQQHKYDMDAISKLNGSTTNNTTEDEENSSNPSSISSQEEPNETPLQPYPFQFTPSSLNNINKEEEERECIYPQLQHPDLLSDMGVRDEAEVASTTWSFSSVGKVDDNGTNTMADLEEQRKEGLIANETTSYTDTSLIGGSSDLFNNVMKFEESVTMMPTSKHEDDNKNDDASLPEVEEGLFIGDDDDDDRGSFIEEILSRHDDSDDFDDASSNEEQTKIGENNDFV